MKIISFAWTTPALVHGQKTVTRRNWDDGYAMSFHAGEAVAAYDRDPRHGGKHVAIIRLTRNPYRESTLEMPASDYRAEGFEWSQERGFKVHGETPEEFWERWHTPPGEDLWVVRFQLVTVLKTAPKERPEPAAALPQGRLL